MDIPNKQICTPVMFFVCVVCSCTNGIEITCAACKPLCHTPTTSYLITQSFGLDSLTYVPNVFCLLVVYAGNAIAAWCLYCCIGTTRRVCKGNATASWCLYGVVMYNPTVSVYEQDFILYLMHVVH